MALIDEDERVVGQIFEQGRGRFARLAACEVTRIVLDAGARTRRFDHFEIEQGPLFEALRLQETARAVELCEALLQLILDAAHGLFQRGLRRHVMRVRVDLHDGELVCLGAGQGIELDDGFDLVAE